MIARLALLVVFIPGVVVAARNVWCQRHRAPAAPDNRIGIDAEALWVCRRIAAQPLADPAGLDRLRTAINQTRKEEL